MFQPGSDFGICRKSYWVLCVCVYKSGCVLFFFFSFTVWKVVKVCLRKCLSILFNVLILSVFLYYCVCVCGLCVVGGGVKLCV